MCNEAGGIIDDTVTYRLSENKYLLICNASNRSAVTDWINWWIKDKYSSTQVEDATLNTSMIAVQGPYAESLMGSLCFESPSSLKFFSSMDNNINDKDIFIGRTGYTGEDGFEIVVNSLNAPAIWNTLVENGMAPCGLGSRDILRLEASLPLHGSDITPEISPLEAGLNRFVKLDKDFVGSDILKAQDANGITKKLIGLIVQGRNLPRHNYSINSNGTVVGIVTSGAYSPTLDRNIAMGYVFPEHSTPLMKLEVDIRGRIAEAEVTALPFYSRKRD
jgi:aminomethyltransferase